jgi:hypothetical protein
MLTDPIYRDLPKDTEMPEVNIVAILPPSSDIHIFSVTLKKDKRYNDAIIPVIKEAVALFYTRAIVAVNCVDNRFRVALLSRVLIDRGSSSNLVPKYLVDQLKIRTVLIKGGKIEDVDSYKSSIDSLV